MVYFPHAEEIARKGSIFRDVNFIVKPDGAILVLINSTESKTGIFVKAPTVGSYFKTADNPEFIDFLNFDDTINLKTIMLWDWFPSFREKIDKARSLPPDAIDRKAQIFAMLKDLPFLPSNSEKYEVVLPFRANLGSNL